MLHKKIAARFDSDAIIVYNLKINADEIRVTEKVSNLQMCIRDSLNTMLNRDFSDQGVEISGGEAQKLAMARAIYKNAPFVILDEPTAALDPVAENEIYTCLLYTSRCV